MGLFKKDKQGAEQSATSYQPAADQQAPVINEDGTVEFPVVERGYAPGAVEAFIEHLLREEESYAQEVQGVIQRLEKQVEEIGLKTKELEQELGKASQRVVEVEDEKRTLSEYSQLVAKALQANQPLPAPPVEGADIVRKAVSEAFAAGKAQGQGGEELLERVAQLQAQLDESHAQERRLRVELEEVRRREEQARHALEELRRAEAALRQRLRESSAAGANAPALAEALRALLTDHNAERALQALPAAARDGLREAVTELAERLAQVSKLEADLRALRAERQRAQSEETLLREELRRLREELERVDSVERKTEEEFRALIREASEVRRKTIERAQQEAETIVAEAKARAAALVDEAREQERQVLAELEEQRSATEEACHRMLERALRALRGIEQDANDRLETIAKNYRDILEALRELGQREREATVRLSLHTDAAPEGDVGNEVAPADSTDLAVQPKATAPQDRADHYPEEEDGDMAEQRKARDEKPRELQSAHHSDDQALLAAAPEPPALEEQTANSFAAAWPEAAESAYDTGLHGAADMEEDHQVDNRAVDPSAATDTSAAAEASEAVHDLGHPQHDMWSVAERDHDISSVAQEPGAAAADQQSGTDEQAGNDYFDHDYCWTGGAAGEVPPVNEPALQHSEDHHNMWSPAHDPQLDLGAESVSSLGEAAGAFLGGDGAVEPSHSDNQAGHQDAPPSSDHNTGGTYTLEE